MSYETAGIVTILEDEHPVAMFPAPPDSHAARSLWIFLVESLRPGLEVALTHGGIRLRYHTGNKIPIELYEHIMDGSSLEET